MSYTSPSNTAVDFEFQSGYSSPTNTSADFTFGKTSSTTKVFSIAAKSDTTAAFGDLKTQTTASVENTATAGGVAIGKSSVTSLAEALVTAIVRRRQGEVFSFSAGRSQSTFSIIGGREITIPSEQNLIASATFQTPAKLTDETQTTVVVSEHQTADGSNDPLFTVSSESTISSETTLLRTALSSVGNAQTSTNKLEVIAITDNVVGANTPINPDYQQESYKIDYDTLSDKVKYRNE